MTVFSMLGERKATSAVVQPVLICPTGSVVFLSVQSLTINFAVIL